MSDDWTLRTLLGNFADLTPLVDGWYTDPNWDPDGVAVAFGGQPIIGSGTIYPPRHPTDHPAQVQPASWPPA